MNKKAWLFISFAYLLTRLYNLMSLPIFNDEAFFIWVGRQIASNPVHNLFLNFSDGKEPLFFWLSALTPTLFLGRLAAVLLGFAGLVAIYKLSQKSLAAVAVFIVSPFLLFYQRLAMQENLLFFFLILGLVFSKNPWLLGTFFGLALLTKTTALVFIVGSLPLWFRNFRQTFHVGAVLLFFYSLIFLSPAAQNIVAHNSQYIGLISPAQFFINLKQAIRWLWEYQSIVFILAVIAPLLIKDKIFGAKLWLAMLVPVILESMVAKIFFPRYFLFSLIPMCLLVGLAVKQHKILMLCLIPGLFLSWQIISNVKTALLPYIERWQYLESWPSGGGIKETAQFLAKQKAQTVVVEEGIMITQFGLPYYYPTAKYFANQTGEYYVFDKEQNNFPPGLKLVFSYPKIGGKERITVYQND